MNAFAHQIQFADEQTGETVMRSFIRHPSDIPIECQVDQAHSHHARKLRNVSYGGLAFTAHNPLEIGAEIRVRIPGIEPAFEVTGQVAWCRKKRDEYVVGVQFLDQDDSYRARMVEQICHIEHYKIEVREKEGRDLTGEQAAEEWIMKFAKDFPSL